jgi:hypothetical protein
MGQVVGVFIRLSPYWQQPSPRCLPSWHPIAQATQSRSWSREGRAESARSHRREASPLTGQKRGDFVSLPSYMSRVRVPSPALAQRHGPLHGAAWYGGGSDTPLATSPGRLSNEHPRLQLRCSGGRPLVRSQHSIQRDVDEERHERNDRADESEPHQPG